MSHERVELHLMRAPAVPIRCEGPRPGHTRYPAVPVWTEAYERAQFAAALAQNDGALATPLALNVHVRTPRHNFMGDVTHAGVDVVGFGLSPISALRGSDAQSERDLGEWATAVRNLAMRFDADLGDPQRLGTPRFSTAV